MSDETKGRWDKQKGVVAQKIGIGAAAAVSAVGLVGAQSADTVMGAGVQGVVSAAGLTGAIGYWTVKGIKRQVDARHIERVNMASGLATGYLGVREELDKINSEITLRRMRREGSAEMRDILKESGSSAYKVFGLAHDGLRPNSRDAELEERRDLLVPLAGELHGRLVDLSVE